MSEAWFVSNIQPFTCPHCGYVMPAAMSPDDPERKGPQPGDFCVCGRCASLLVVATGGRSLRSLNVAELALILARPDLANNLAVLQQAVRQARAELRARNN